MYGKFAEEKKQFWYVNIYLDESALVALEG